MKKLILLTACGFNLVSAHEELCFKKKPKPQEPAAQIEEEDDDVDGEVVLANVANMLNCMGIISTDPYNPAIVGPSIAQIGVGFINILTQIFKDMPMRGHITREDVQQWFDNLPEKTKTQLVALIMVYADCYRNKALYDETFNRNLIAE